MIECGVVIDRSGQPFHWHLPPGRTAGSIPDTRSLWDVFWETREKLWGFAHSHPGGGVPGPSHTDITTFMAVEAALGKRLNWWITSSEKLIRCRRLDDKSEPHICVLVKGKPVTYGTIIIADEPSWAAELRRISGWPFDNQ